MVTFSRHGARGLILLAFGAGCAQPQNGSRPLFDGAGGDSPTERAGSGGTGAIGGSSVPPPMGGGGSILAGGAPTGTGGSGAQAGGVSNGGSAQSLGGFAGGGGAGASGATAGSAGASSAACLPAKADGSAPVIDDLSDGIAQILENEGRVGGWYSYGDSKISIVPPVAGTFTVSAGTATISGTTAVCSSTDTMCWGGGMGFSFSQQGAQRCPYDASHYMGIRMKYRATVPFRVRVLTPASATSFNDFGVNVVAATVTATLDMPFADMRQQDTGSGIPVARIDPAQLLAMQFQVGPGLTNFSVAVSQLTFY